MNYIFPDNCPGKTLLEKAGAKHHEYRGNTYRDKCCIAKYITTPEITGVRPAPLFANLYKIMQKIMASPFFCGRV